MVEVAPHKAGAALESAKADESGAANPKPPKIAGAASVPVPADDQSHKVVHIVRQLREDTDEIRVSKKRPWVLISILACVVLPTLLTSAFYLFIAADRYSSRVAFVVRGGANPSDFSESFIVADFVKSPEMVRRLEQRIPLRAIYADDRADVLSRLDSDASFEQLAAYWNRFNDTYYDSAKNTISVEVQAFTPEDTFKVATETLSVVGELVNNLGLQSRQSALQAATTEVAGAEARARQARLDLLQFQRANAGPATTGATSGQSGAQPAASELPSIESIAAFEVLQVKQAFADKAYTDSLAALEHARADAGRTTSYLAVFAHPSQPEEASYPRRGFNILMVLILSSVVWAVGALGVMTVRDHLP